MCATGSTRGKKRQLLLEHCLATPARSGRPAARDRLAAALGEDLSRRLVVALTQPRAA